MEKQNKRTPFKIELIPDEAIICEMCLFNALPNPENFQDTILCVAEDKHQLDQIVKILKVLPVDTKNMDNLERTPLK
jgi:hypothetical protein